MKRLDLDPNFLTFLSFNNMGSRTMKKFTQVKFENNLTPEELKHIENQLTDVFASMHTLVDHNTKDPEALFAKLNKIHPLFDRETFMSEVWSCYKDHIA